MRLKWLFATLMLLLFACAIGAAIAFGGPKQAAPMASISDPFKAVDFSQVPSPSTYRAADGAMLSYRAYEPSMSTRLGSVVLVHGSSSKATSMHPLAMGLRASGFRVYALDMRGHGASGVKGQIDYIGQLESDVVAFVQAVRPSAPSTLLGFSSGGGFALRFAGSQDQALFQSYLLLSPFISEDAPNQRPGNGGWVQVGVPRILGLIALNAVGIRAFNDLPVSRFALDDASRKFLTPEYGFNLAQNFRPQRDYVANMQAAHQPCAILAGTGDEVFATESLEPMVRTAGLSWPVQLLPGVGHISLTLDPGAIAEAVSIVDTLQASSN